MSQRHALRCDGGDRPQPRLAVRYVRQALVAPAPRMKETVDRLHRFADLEGFELGSIFVEPPDDTLVAFRALVDAVEHHRARAVVLPNLLHFAMLWPPSTIRSQFEYLTGVRVLPAVGRDSALIRRAGVPAP